MADSTPQDESNPCGPQWRRALSCTCEMWDAKCRPILQTRQRRPQWSSKQWRKSLCMMQILLCSYKTTLMYSLYSSLFAKSAARQKREKNKNAKSNKHINKHKRHNTGRLMYSLPRSVQKSKSEWTWRTVAPVQPTPECRSLTCPRPITISSLVAAMTTPSWKIPSWWTWCTLVGLLHGSWTL